MNAFVCSHKSPLYLAKPSPWNPKISTLLPTSLRNPNDLSRKWQLHGNAKGFASSKPPLTEDGTRNINEQNNSDHDDEIPKEVFNRITKRILVSVGAPMALEQGIWDVPLWLPFTTTFLTLGTSALGIAYGALSTSLDPNKKGSLLGLEEAQRNWAETWKEEDESK
ncbi:hypothetical protein P3X46_023831 [Hevea brasiliensis]|uniref:Uncharacterized protein n=1 Tax=Hevea brasiliensis TaxID=3981 RepID=A0ABQ9LE34_HEVBR|nr:hypothetical protein P3X46_023831 [Hevea brasiliensis]